jgi:hypothetical protein
MTTHDDTDRRIAAWFGDEHVRAPERTIEAALAHARSHPRRRDPFAALRRDPMSSGVFGGGLFAPVPLVAAIGLIVAAVLGAAVAGGFLDRPAPAVPPSPSPTASPATAPTSGPKPLVFHVDLVEVAGDDASIDITDASGSIVSAESGQPRDGGSVPEGVDVAADPADPAVAVLTWTGGPCDTTHALAIEADGRTMTLSRPTCLGDAIPRDLQLRLRFREPIDVSTISASLVTGQG